MEINFGAIIGLGKNKKDPKKVVTERLIPISETKTKEDLGMVDIKEEIKKFILKLEERDSREDIKRIEAVNSGREIDNSVLRTIEAGFQNSLLRIIYKYNLSFENIDFWIKKIIAENAKRDSTQIQSRVLRILEGVKNCEEAVRSFKKELESKNKDKEIGLATNDQFDAQYNIDFLAWVEGKDGLIEVLNLVQVKSTTNKKQIEDITQTHQDYLDTLPKLIGMLNKQQAETIASKEVEQEVIDIDRREENEEQFILFGLVLDKYINTLESFESANAAEFFKLFKEEGGLLNPFTVMGILKSKEALEKYRKKYFTGDNEAEKYLSSTADKIPFTEAESIAFHKIHNVHTIIDSVKIVSIIMEKGKKVGEVVLKHPYSNLES